MFENNPDFYPTPIWLIKKMLQPYKKPVHVGGINGYQDKKGYGLLEDLIILEPSAGKGDIVNFITGSYIIKTKEQKIKAGDTSAWYDEESVKSVSKEQIYCIEKDPNLRHILNSNGYRVIASDFLTYKPENHFDLIIMNPPFSVGDQHLLKAWDVLENGDIVCLLNAETIRNPYTERRRHLLQLIVSNKGTVEFLQDEFIDAERTTKVEVALVRITKKTKDSRFDFKFKTITKEKSFDLNEDSIKDIPATLDVIGNMIVQFDKVKETFIKFMSVQAELDYYSEPITNFNYDHEYRGIINLCDKLKGSRQERFNQFSDIIRDQMWQTVISQMGVEHLLTRKVKEDFKKFRTAQGQMQFTKENIREIIEMLLLNGTTILEEAIVEVFDALTQHHEYNRMFIEGWKTNSAWKVNKKIIFPYGCSFDQKWFNQGYNTKFSVSERYSDTSYSDIDKVLAYISRKDYKTEVCTIAETMSYKFQRLGYLVKGHDKFDNTCESTFFKIKFWKKGTVHLEFLDESLWAEFNMRACYGKKWLPWEEEKVWKNSKTPESEVKTEIKQINAPILQEEDCESLY